ncbi:pyridoxamine 5'-phosphate oxidase family protein [Lentilactobacillus kribbianus]|uniref:pyridoxamine 5'-phosphate oxidase family protein n=1 Tax=Lentilactobacillus kribbianus TaxID=2729622 RepID=UPI0015579DAE|nr:pyridoxamine 5'-phosphate oxidase family protein [Lentilactobacillus kribbianus]
MNVTEEMKNMLQKKLAYIATVDGEGNPDIGPKMTMQLYDDSHLYYNEFTAGQTMKNIQQTGKAAVAVVDAKAMKGFRFTGKAEIVTDGPYFDQMVATETAGGNPAPKYVGVIAIDQVYWLDIGPKAGTAVK